MPDSVSGREKPTGILSEEAEAERHAGRVPETGRPGAGASSMSPATGEAGLPPDSEGSAPGPAPREAHGPGIISWPVDESDAHPRARPEPNREDPESWDRLAEIAPAFGQEALPSPAEDLAAYRRARRVRRLVFLLVAGVVAAAAGWGLKQPAGKALVAYARTRLGTLDDQPGDTARDAGKGISSLLDTVVATGDGTGGAPGTSSTGAVESTALGAAASGDPRPIEEAPRGTDVSEARNGEDGDRAASQAPSRPLVNMAVGYLYLKTVPPADVYIDGVKLSERTPLRGYPVAKGRRKLVVKTDSGETRGPFTIIVRAGKKKFIRTIVIDRKRKRSGGK